MQITSRFTIAIHLLTCLDHFQDSATVTSNFLAGSIGVNPVIVRTVMSQLREAGIISISQGKSGITLAKPLEKITFFDVYQAVECVGEQGIFHFHENPNPNCPVGRSIHSALDAHLLSVQQAMEQQMRQITVAQVAQNVQSELMQGNAG